MATARAIMGSEDALRRAAPSPGAFSMWRHAGKVPWHAVGPRLLQLWRQATTGRGLIAQERVQGLLAAAGLNLGWLEQRAKDVESIRRMRMPRMGFAGYMKRSRKPRKRRTTKRRGETR